MNSLILVISYFIGVIRILVGLEIFFKKKTKITGLVIGLGTVYALCLIWVEQSAPLLMYIFVCITAYCMTEGARGEKLFQILILFCVFGSLDELVGITIKYWVADEKYIRLFEAVIVLIFVCFLKEALKCDIKVGKYIAILIKTRIIVVILMMVILLSSIITGFYYAEEYTLHDDLKYYITVLAFVGMIILLMFIIYIKDSNETMQKLVDTERFLKETQRKYYKELLEREADTRKYRHDMQNHLLCLVKYIENEDVEKGLAYIRGLQDSFDAIQKRCYLSGNDLLDIFLNHYLLPLKEVKINIWGVCSDDIAISDVDFCIIISNLLQNTAEAIERQKTRERYIRVIMKPRAEYCEINIQNSIAPEAQITEETSKTDKKNHGIGLKNVSEVVRKNGGFFEFGIKNEEFFATVILKRGKKE